MLFSVDFRKDLRQENAVVSQQAEEMTSQAQAGQRKLEALTTCYRRLQSQIGMSHTQHIPNTYPAYTQHIHSQAAQRKLESLTTCYRRLQSQIGTSHTQHIYPIYTCTLAMAKPWPSEVLFTLGELYPRQTGQHCRDCLSEDLGESQV